MTLRAYMGYVGDPEEGACLVFARDAREAKSLAFECCHGWWPCEWTDIRVKWLKRPEDQHLFAEANQVKLHAGQAHAIESPIPCPRCERWGYPRVYGPDAAWGITGPECCEGCQDWGE